MGQRPPWEVDSSSSPEITCIVWNMMVHYCLHKIPPVVPILGLMQPFSTLPSYLFNCDFNVLPPALYSQGLSPFCWLKTVYARLPHTFYMTHPSSPPPPFDYLIIYVEQHLLIMNHLLLIFSLLLWTVPVWVLLCCSIYVFSSMNVQT
jgi:hypothetical protein